MFPGSPVDRYRSLVLRGGKNDQHNPFIKDELVRQLHKDMGAANSNGRMVNLFINGNYKGYYNLCERIDEEFLQEWYGGSKDDWDVISQSGCRDGDKAAWKALFNYIRYHDLSDDANYQEVGKQLDIVSFIDYLILELYSGNKDWPRNNWIVGRQRSDDGKFRFYMWDAESTMMYSQLYEVDLKFSGFQEGQGFNSKESPIGRLYLSLKSNDDFRRLFANRIQEHFYNDGALTNANITDRFLELRSEMSGVLPDMDMFILDTFVLERRDVMLNAFTQEGLFDISGSPSG